MQTNLYHVIKKGFASKQSMKAGVSLIIVLLFMLIATIAATATWKWITSEGKSSASRMLQREAYQSSMAGIENARTWMTFHANDVGALIKQFVEDENHNPINIDNRLRPLQRAGQNYHVWLTGVNTENSTFKVKILSSGEARNDARHTETAIFNVDGLYQVSVPKVVNHAVPNFDYAYYAGGFHSTQVTVTSAAVNGNWNGNPPVVTKNWIVTGNATLDGNNVNVGGTSCIGGNVTTNNNGFSTTNLYVGGNFTGLLKSATGDAYFEGNAIHGGTGSITIGGNLTVNGKLVTAQDASDRAINVAGNLCVDENGTVVSRGTTDVFQVDGNVWMPGNHNLWYGVVNGSGCTCKKYNYSYTCSYKDCECTWQNWGGSGIWGWFGGGWGESYTEACNENALGSWNKRLVSKSCTTTPYEGECGQYTSGATINGQYHSITVTANIESVSQESCNFGDADLISCTDYTIGTSGDNYSAYEKIFLGSKNTSKVYIKTAYPSTEYESTLRGTNKTFTEPNQSTGTPRMCDGYNGNCVPGYWTLIGTPAETYSPYISRGDGAADRYYIYYMPSGVKDVDFGTYQDSYWNTEISAYFVNASANNMDTRFTSSHHSQDDNHPVLTSSGYYRYLNHTGTVITGSPYCYLASGKEWRPECNVTPWFKSNGEVVRSFSDAARTFKCAEDVRSDCYDLWEETPGTGCEGSNFRIKDPLVMAYESFIGYAQKGCAASINVWPATSTDANHPISFTKMLQDCYDEGKANPQNLYNGFLVVDLTSTDGNYVQESTELTGKYIIVVEEQLQPGQNGLLNIADGSYVLYYLKKGAKYIQKDAKNSFIYTEGNIGESSGLNLSGSIYAPSVSCARADLKDAVLTYNQTLIQELMNANIICNNDNSPCGGASSSLSSSSTVMSSASTTDDDIVHNSKDRYFISMAPQLGITLESQSKSNEELPPLRQNAEKPDLDASFIVLPRVVFLPNDPHGAFEDYIKVLPLNGGAPIVKSSISISCSPVQGTTGSLPITSIASKIYTAGSPTLDQGNYKCQIGASGYEQSVPVWVVVGESYRSVPAVYFIPDFQEIEPTGQKTVSVFVPPHDQAIDLNVYCPATTPAGWTVTYLESNSGTEPNCVFHIDANPDGPETIELISVSTSNAAGGSLAFQLMPGEGYNLSVPIQSQLYMAAKATLNRLEASHSEISSYCADHPNVCPDDIANWPDCNAGEAKWVQPSGISFIEDYRNKSWTIMTGGTGTVRLVPVSSSCVTIIPDMTLNVADLAAGQTYSLKASAKSSRRVLTVKFVGDVGDGLNPIFNIKVSGRSPVSCQYTNSSTECTVDVFSNELVSLYIDKSLTDNENFSYWKCKSGSCSTTNYAVTSATYEPFTVTEDGTVVEVHFGEQDKHCFFDEFRNADVVCSNLAASLQKYCIDYCGDDPSTNSCESAGATGQVFSNAKWHLVKGLIGDVQYDSYSGAVSVNKNADVTVMSTVDAGRSGTLKAVVQIPRLGSSNGTADSKIRNTGFLLRSDASATRYLMLNVFADHQNRVAAQVCPVNGSAVNGSCLTDVLTRNSSSLHVSQSNMMMVMATITRSDELTVSAYEGNYYGSPNVYSKTFDLSKLSMSENQADEYVGYRIANADFKLYGIGWLSEEYAQECHETPPMVKCSFAARAVDGIVPIGEAVEPWVGHSGWFDSREYSCETKYYYYNGTDACGGSSNTSVSCPSQGYTFDQSGTGKHGYNDDESGEMIKTAKAGIHCSLNGAAGLWAADPEDANTGESNRAHCGSFWTGEFSECREHRSLSTGEVLLSYSGAEQTIAFDMANLRAASLIVTMDNPENSNVEVWLSSSEDWYGGELHSSPSVSVSGNRVELDVVDLFSGGAGGFNPEKVVQVGFLNKGPGSVTIKTVNSICSKVVGVANCSAKLEGNHWNIQAKIINIDDVTHYEVTGSRNDPGPAHDDETLSPLSQTANDVAQNDGVVNFTYLMDPPKPGDYSFAVSVSPDNGTTKYSTDCTVESKVHEVTCTTGLTVNSIPLGVESPVFNFKLEHCPPTGCGGYIVKLGSTTVTNGEGSCPGAGVGHEKCEVSLGGPEQNAVGTYTYSVTSTSDPVRFTCEARSFTVEAASSTSTESSASVEDFEVDCGPIVDQTGNLGANIFVTPHSVSGCSNGDCSYDIKLGETSVLSGVQSNYSGGRISFTGASSAGKKDYVLTIYSPTSASSESCNFSVTYSSESSGGTATCNWNYGGSDATNLYPGISNNLKLIISDNSLSEQSVKLKCTGTTVEKTQNCKNCEITQVPTPSIPGTYACTVKTTSDNTLVCSPTLNVVAPFTCSTSPSGPVTSGTSVTLSVATASGYGATFGNCGFYNGSNCDGDCNGSLSETSKTFNITSATTLKYKCNNVQNSSYNECSVDIALQAPANISTAACNQLRQGAKAGDDFVIRPTVENCAGNCSYTITGEGANVSGSGWTSGTAMNSFTHAVADDSISYTLEVWNTYNTSHATCSFKVKYGNATPVPVVYKNYSSYKAGNTYELTLAGGNVFRCTFTTANAFTIGTFNGSTFSANAYSGGHATVANPGEGKKVTFIVSNDDNGSLQCATDW